MNTSLKVEFVFVSPLLYSPKSLRKNVMRVVNKDGMA